MIQNKSNQQISRANQLTGFYLMGTLVVKGLRITFFKASRLKNSNSPQWYPEKELFWEQDFLKLVAWVFSICLGDTNSVGRWVGVEIYLFIRVLESTLNPKKNYPEILHFTIISYFFWNSHFTLPAISLSNNLILQTPTPQFVFEKRTFKFQIY